jgi:hypothetical protein
MADKKVTQLTALTGVANTDLLLIVDDPAGTPVSKKVELEDIFGATSQTVFASMNISTTGDTTLGANNFIFDPTTNTTFNRGVVINETGAASNTRIESDNQTNMLFIDALNDRIGVKTNAPTVSLDVNDSRIRIRGISSVSSSNAAAEGWSVGEIGWDNSYLYVAVSSTGANSILRTALSGF